MKNLFTFCLVLSISASILPKNVTAQQGELTVFWGVNRAQTMMNPTADDQVKSFKGYEVTGKNMVLYGNNITDVFTKDGIGRNMHVRLDASTQEFSVLHTDRQRVIVLGWEEIDSFYVKIDSTDLSKAPTTYLNGMQFGNDNKFFLERLFESENVSLYKMYSTDLRAVTGSLVEDRKRVFEMNHNYFYTTADNPNNLVPIKANFKGLLNDKIDAKAANKILQDRMFPKESRLKLYFEEFGKFY